MTRQTISSLTLLLALLISTVAMADSVNSPNIRMQADTNRSVGNGAGNVAVTVNTITLAEIQLNEFSSGTGKQITVSVRNGYQFDPSSPITASSPTVGINGGALNATASVTPTGAANEVITFRFTSGASTTVQDIIRINGVKLKIISAAGAAGPSQNTMQITTTAVGGSFNNQGIVTTTITKGLPNRLEFAVQPGSAQAGAVLLPAVKIVDFGGNVITDDPRTISLTLQTNPGATTLLGTTQVTTNNGVASWSGTEALNITAAANGYVLQATHSGNVFLASDSVNSNAFNITAGNPGRLAITSQPASTTAGEDITLSVSVLDEFDNPTTANGVEVTLDSANNPGGWPLLVDSSLTKESENGVVSWGADDNLRINKAITGYTLSVSGLGEPLTTSTFNINAGPASQLRFVEQPSDTKQGATMAPAVAVDFSDALGNRTADVALVNLGASSRKCGDLSGADGVISVAGVATFDSLSFSKACDDVQLLATANGVIGAASDRFTIQAKNAVPIGVRSLILRPRKLFQMNARGSFSVPKSRVEDPTREGAVLTVSSETGAARYVLGKRGWRRVAGGFQFSGSGCESVVVTKNTISAVCRGRTGNISLPASELDVVLKLGKGTAKFCGQCGGTSRGDESKVFSRANCAKALSCP